MSVYGCLAKRVMDIIFISHSREPQERKSAIVSLINFRLTNSISYICSYHSNGRKIQSIWVSRSYGINWPNRSGNGKYCEKYGSRNFESVH